MTALEAIIALQKRDLSMNYRGRQYIIGHKRGPLLKPVAVFNTMKEVEIYLNDK